MQINDSKIRFKWIVLGQKVFGGIVRLTYGKIEYSKQIACWRRQQLFVLFFLSFFFFPFIFLMVLIYANIYLLQIQSISVFGG